MNTAIRYFIRDLPAYFQWSYASQELQWCDGQTVLFRQELLPLLLKLQSTGRCADIGSIAILFAARRSSWADVSRRLTTQLLAMVNCQLDEVQSQLTGQPDVLLQWGEAVRRLALLRGFAEDRRAQPEDFTDLLTMILQKCPTEYSGKEIERLVDDFRGGFLQHWTDTNPADAALLAALFPRGKGPATDPEPRLMSAACRHILRLIHLAVSVSQWIPGGTVDELFSVLRTGIRDPAAVRAVSNKPQEPEDQQSGIRRLLQELENTRRYRGLSKLSSRLVAALSLPRQLSEPESLQLGGVSDISNRGSIDKLLLSELVHDDLTLSVRLALNEALYLRRESPPARDRRIRSVFIDCSLPMWGLPRLYATAVALALHVTSDRQTSVRCFRTEHTRLVDCSLDSPAAVSAHLQSLSSLASPAKLLEQFHERMGELQPAAEPVIITTRDVLQMPEFRRCLDAVDFGTIWLIIVERGGDLEILKKTRQGFSSLRRVLLPLSEILSEAEAEALQNDDRIDDLPAIFRRRHFPLLLSVQFSVGRAWSWGRNVVSITDAGRLMFWTDGQRGARELDWLSVTDRHQFFVLQKNHDVFWLLQAEPGRTSGLLIRIRLSDLDVAMQTLEHKVCQITDVTQGDSGVLMFGVDYAGRKVCSELAWHDVSGAEPLVTSAVVCLPKDIAWRLGRVLKLQDGSFHVVSVVQYGAICSMQKLPNWVQSADQVVEYAPGRYMARLRGSLADISRRADDEPVFGELKGRILGFEEVSSEGLVAVRVKGMSGLAIVDMSGDRVVATDVRRSPALEVWLVRQLTERFRLRSRHWYTSVGTDGKVVFLGNKSGKVYVVQPVGLAVILSEYSETVRVRMRDFAGQQMGPVADPGLWKVSWISGGIIWQDPRGLLHLRSADSQHAEVTLVLARGEVAGWTSAGVIFGEDAYFEPTTGINSATNGLKRMEPAVVWRTVMIPLLESLQ